MAVAQLQSYTSQAPTAAQRTLVDLFAGSGGLSLGLEMAGFRPVFVNEIDPSAMETYLLNRRDRYPALENNRVHDIHDLTERPGELEALARRLRNERSVVDLDLLVGGPPCQGYSGIGHRRTFTGMARAGIPSNHLYTDMAQVIRVLRPKMFLFENVKGLLSGRWTPDGEKGQIWHQVRETFGSIDGYDTDWDLVHAKAYGVPQNRPRVLLVGIRSDLHWTPTFGEPAGGLLPRPSGTVPDPEDFLGDLVDPEYERTLRTSHYPVDAATEAQTWFRRDPHEGAPRPSGFAVSEQEYSRHNPRITAKFQHMLDNGGRVLLDDRTKKFAQRVIPRKWGSNGPSMTVTSLPDDYVHFSQPRTLTVREWARFQTFPDWYEFVGKRTTGGQRRAGNPWSGDWTRELPKYTQIGNAVPVWLAHKLGEHFRTILG